MKNAKKLLTSVGLSDIISMSIKKVDKGLLL